MMLQRNSILDATFSFQGVQCLFHLGLVHQVWIRLFHASKVTSVNPLKFQGACTPVHGKDIVDSVKDLTSEIYRWFLDIIKRYGSAAGLYFGLYFHGYERRSFKSLDGKR